MNRLLPLLLLAFLPACGLFQAQVSPELRSLYKAEADLGLQGYAMAAELGTKISDPSVRATVGTKIDAELTKYRAAHDAVAAGLAVAAAFDPATLAQVAQIVKDLRASVVRP